MQTQGRFNQRGIREKESLIRSVTLMTAVGDNWICHTTGAAKVLSSRRIPARPANCHGGVSAGIENTSPFRHRTKASNSIWTSTERWPTRLFGLTANL